MSEQSKSRDLLTFFSLGRTISIQCKDGFLEENEVIFRLMLFHIFDQANIPLTEGSVFLFPDYSVGTFGEERVKLLDTNRSRRSLFFPVLVEDPSTTKGVEAEEEKVETSREGYSLYLLITSLLLKWHCKVNTSNYILL